MDSVTFDGSYKALLFSVAVYVLSLLIRRAVELVVPTLKTAQTRFSNVWQYFMLPAMPVLLGALVGALLTSFPYPAALSTRPLHAMYGMVCGFFAGWSYRILKAIAQKKWEVTLPGDPDDKLGALLAQLPPDQLLSAQAKVGEVLLNTTPPGGQK